MPVRYEKQNNFDNLHSKVKVVTVLHNVYCLILGAGARCLKKTIGSNMTKKIPFIFVVNANGRSTYNGQLMNPEPSNSNGQMENAEQFNNHEHFRPPRQSSTSGHFGQPGHSNPNGHLGHSGYSNQNVDLEHPGSSNQNVHIGQPGPSNPCVELGYSLRPNSDGDLGHGGPPNPHIATQVLESDYGNRDQRQEVDGRGLIQCAMPRQATLTDVETGRRIDASTGHFLPPNGETLFSVYVLFSFINVALIYRTIADLYSTWTKLTNLIEYRCQIFNLNA